MDKKTIIAIIYYIPLLVASILGFISAQNDGIVLGMEVTMPIVGWIGVVLLSVLGLVIYIQAWKHS